MTWTAPEPRPVDGPMVGPDRPLLEGYLDWQRATLLNICAGLSAAQLAQRPIESSNLSLLGLVRHLTKVERIWFVERLGGQSLLPMYDAALGKDADFDDVQPADAPAAVDRWQEQCRAAREIAAGHSFDDTITSQGELMSLRMIVVHMIGEYSRHNGHADMLREAVDGVTGR
jgi:uncharacterized damage-inducible protein DinB